MSAQEAAGIRSAIDVARLGELADPNAIVRLAVATERIVEAGAPRPR